MRMSSKQTFDDVQSTRSIVSSIVVCTNSTRVVQAGFMDHIYDYRGCVYRLKKKCTTYYMVWTYWSPLLPWLTQVCSFEGMDCEMDCDVVARCSFV